VTVVDTTVPTITCPANVTVNANTGQCYASGIALGTPTASDNCGTPTVSNNAPAQYPKGVTTVTWTAQDTSGNTATCAQTVTVIDNQLPSITCPANVTVSTDSGQCYATVALGTPATSDNCGTPTVSNNAPAHFNKGVTTVTWTVTDSSGNTATCAQTVTVNDTQAPTITCPADVTVAANDGCTATNVALVSPVTGDNCGVASVTSNAPAVYALGTNMVTWTVTDGSGNTATCAQRVVVRDTTPPAIICPANVTVNADPGHCYATGVALGTPATSDNCGGSIAVTNNAPVSYPVGGTLVTWTAVDTSGNRAACSQTVTVLGGAACYTIAGCTAINVVLGNLVADDNCSVASVVNDAPAIYPLGTNYVTWTVTDGSGNTATYTQRVIVLDTTAPTISCPANVTVSANAGNTATNVALGSPVTADNCSVASVGNNAPAAYPLGANSVIWTVTDGSGNTAACVQSVTVVSASVPPGTPAISSPGGAVTITWVSGVLQQADDVLGPYSDVPGATSPWPVGGSAPQKFYRVRGTGP
jgi:hypothetical protein